MGLFSKQLTLFFYKKFFRKGSKTMTQQEYFLELKEEIIKQGGALSDLLFISDEMIENAIKNKRSPKDLAWEILQ